MKIGVISDTHDRLESINKAVQIFKENKVEEIIHCGDWISPFVVNYFEDFKVKGILGNNKGDIDTMKKMNAEKEKPLDIDFENPSREFILDNRKCNLIHGQDKDALDEAIKSQKFDCIFTGHNHLSKNEINGKTLILNPGSTAFIVAGKIVDTASVAIYDTQNNTARIIEYLKSDV